MYDLTDVTGARALIDIASPKLNLAARTSIVAKIDAEISIVEENFGRAEKMALKSISDFETSTVSRPWMKAEARLLLDKIHLLQGRKIDAARNQQDINLLTRTMSKNHRSLNFTK